MALAAFVTLASHPALAETDGGTEPAFVLPPVEVVGEAPASGYAPAAQSTVIDVARFAGEVRSVAELLATSPGVTPHPLGGPGQATTLSLRGASADESLILLDGIPLQGPAGGAVDLATLPASLLSRLVVSRGVLGAQLGAGALGGAVELLPRKPTGKIEGGAQLSAGSYGTAQLAADVSGRLEGAGAWTAAVQLDTTQGDFPFQRQLTPDTPGAPWVDDQRQNADAHRAAGLLRWSGQLDASTEVDFIFQGSAGRRGLPGPIVNFTTHARESDAGGVAGVRVRGSAGPAMWTARVWGRGDRIALVDAGNGFDDCSACGTELARAWGGRAEAELGIQLGERQWLSLSANGGGEWISSDGTGKHDRAVTSVAAADELRLPWGSLSLYPAIRIDRVGELWAASPGLAATARPWRSSGATGTPLLRALAPIELRAGVGRSFRPASFGELYLDRGGIASNPLLQPERATSVDAGLAWNGEALTLSLGGFFSRYQNLIVYEQSAPSRAKPFNIGAADISGFELSAVARLPLGPGTERGPGTLTLEVAYSFLHSVNREESASRQGNALPYRPPHRLFARAAEKCGRLEAFFELSFTSSMPRDEFASGTLPAQLVLSGGASARVFGPLWLGLELRNLLDDQRQQDLFLYPLPGLTALAVARVRL